MFLSEGIADERRLGAVRAEGGLGVFVRSILGLDRQAAKQAFSSVLDLGKMSANQILFINLIVDYLTERGEIDPGLLYDSPFTDIDDRGLV